MTKKEFNDVAKQYLTVTAAIKQLEKEKEELKAKLQKSLKDGIFETKEFKAWQSDYTYEKFCSAEFREAYPKMYKQFTVMAERSNFYCKEV